MPNEIPPPNKGEQVKGGPPIIENAQLPRMGEAKLLEKSINGAPLYMTMRSHPSTGPNLMAPVPQHSLSQQGAGEKSAYQPQQRKPTGQQPAASEGYIRLHMHVTNGQMSVVGAQLVPGPLLQPQILHHDHAYEVTVGSNQIAVESLPDLMERRSYPNPHAPSGQEGHNISQASSYDFIARIARNTLSLAQLPQMRIALYQVSEAAKHTPMVKQPLYTQFGQNIREVAQINGLRLEQLPVALQDTLRRALQ
jgi:hypothetical protein